MAWTGKLLRIDLDKEKHSNEEIHPRVLQNTIGGKGLGVYYLNKQDPTLDALDPDNTLILATGPAQGTVPIAGRYCIVTKSPHTGIFLDSHVGGHLGPELKFAGYDALLVKGRANSPSYIEIVNDQISIKKADSLWGKNIMDTQDQIRDEVDPRARIIAIGPAGEHQVHIAATNSDYFRTAARGGVGMLFGSKNLKAIAIRGTNSLEIHNPDALRDLRRDINRRARQSALSGHQLPKLGTSWLVTLSSARDQLPTMNYQRGEWDQAEEIEGKVIEEIYCEKIQRKPCYRCPLACAYVIQTDFDWANNSIIQHPEYESLALLGSNLGISDLPTLLHANHLCNILGLDTISTGSVISWFMECAERGVVPMKYKQESIHFGDTEGTLELITKIANKEGVGSILGQGVRRAAKVFNNGSEAWAVHVRGLELPAWDPRGKLGLGLSYITSNVGGSHLRGWPVTSEIPDKSALPVIDSMIREQDLKILKDSLIMCHFTHSIDPSLTIEDTARIYEVLTGIPSTESSMREIAQRIWIMCRNFNVGVWQDSTPRETDILPPRLMKDQLPSGIAKGATSFVSEDDLNKSLNYFYEKRNCYPSGIPKEAENEKLQQLLP